MSKLLTPQNDPVCRYHQPRQITSNTVELNFCLLSDCNVLPDPNDSINDAKLITARICVEKHLYWCLGVRACVRARAHACVRASARSCTQLACACACACVCVGARHFDATAVLREESELEVCCGLAVLQSAVQHLRVRVRVCVRVSVSVYARALARVCVVCASPRVCVSARVRACVRVRARARVHVGTHRRYYTARTGKVPRD